MRRDRCGFFLTARLPGLAELMIVDQMAQRAHGALRPFHQGHAGCPQWKQDVGVYGTADDRTENRNWLIRGGSSIRNGQGKSIAAFEFFRSRIVGLQIDSDDVYTCVVDKRLEQTRKDFVVVVHCAGTVQGIIQVAEIGQDFG